MGNGTGKTNQSNAKETPVEKKILFLGLPDSGVENILTKIKTKFPMKPNEEYKSVIYYHALQSALELLKGCELLDIPTKRFDIIKNIPNKFGLVYFTPFIGREMAAFWEDKNVKGVFKRRNELKLKQFTEIQHAQYFLGNIIRLSEPTYIPNDDDVRYYVDNFGSEDIKGIEEIKFVYGNVNYRIFYVECVMEKTNWQIALEGSEIIAFVCPIGKFDEKPKQGSQRNVVQDSLLIFGKMCNSKVFSSCPVLLFFTGYEEFEKKSKDTDLICCFEDYSGGCQFETALKFISKKFFDVRKEKKGLDNIYVHFVLLDTTGEEIVDNIGGTFQNIDMMKTLDDPKQKEEVVAEQK